MILHPRTILRAPAPYHDHRMLLYIMPLALNIRRYASAGAQPDPGELALRGIRLLRLHGANAQAYPLHLGPVLERWRCAAPRLLWLPAALEDLVEGREARRRGAERPGGWAEGGWVIGERYS